MSHIRRRRTYGVTQVTKAEVQVKGWDCVRLRVQPYHGCSLDLLCCLGLWHRRQHRRIANNRGVKNAPPYPSCMTLVHNRRPRPQPHLRLDVGHDKSFPVQGSESLNTPLHLGQDA